MIKNITTLEGNVVNGGSACICAPDPAAGINIFSYAGDAADADACKQFCVWRGNGRLYSFFYFNPDVELDRVTCLALVVDHMDIFTKIEG